MATQTEILKLCMCKMIGSAAEGWDWSELEAWGKREPRKKNLEKDSEYRTVAQEVHGLVRSYLLDNNLEDAQYEQVL